eukprot:4645034-Lingulodinium_polyedra.AAC.1
MRCSGTPLTGSSSSRRGLASGTPAPAASRCQRAPTAGGASRTSKDWAAPPRTAAGPRRAAAN